MPEPLVKLDVILFVIFLICGWLVVLLGSPTLRRDRQPKQWFAFVLGTPIFAALCLFFVFAASPANTSSKTLSDEWVIAWLTPIFILAALGGIIALPLALRARYRQRHSSPHSGAYSDDYDRASHHQHGSGRPDWS